MTEEFTDFEYWERRGETYEELDDIRSKRTAYRIVNMIKLLGLNRGSWILDAGCGGGDITKVVRDNFRHSNVLGIDLSNRMIGGAKIKQVPGLKFFGTDFFHFVEGMGISFFDLIMMSLFIHHLTDDRDKKAVELVYKTLKPKGHILIAEAIPPEDSVFDHYSEIFKLKETRNCYTLSDLLKLVRGGGFVDLKFMTYRFDIRLKSWLNDSTLSPEKKKLIYSMHTNASDEFKKAYAMRPLLRGDYRLRCKMAIVTGKKS